MNIIIPLIMLIAVICITLQLEKDRQAVKQRRAKEAATRRSIEQRVLKTVREKAEYWDNFDIALYVEYLEAKEHE